jgi:hypothetical protein
MGREKERCGKDIDRETEEEGECEINTVRKEK